MRQLPTVFFILAVSLSACRTEKPPASGAGGGDMKVTVAADVWTRVARERVFFGHQSVGDNILRGIAELEADIGHQPLRVHDLAQGSVPGAALLHRHVGTNGDPLSKIRAFRETVDSEASGLDVAALKFCFWDIRRETDVKDVFTKYEQTIAELHDRHPGVRFLHITVPLFAPDEDWRANLRRLFGRPVPRTLDNARRQELSDLIRRRYEGREPVFDLARVEGAPETESGVPYLRPELTTDGGHLNAAGRRLAAEGFLRALASAGDGSGKVAAR
jgi:hypothetical protein